MNKRIFAAMMFLLAVNVAGAKKWYMATNGSDSNNGDIDSPFATLPYAQKKMSAGDTLMIRGGKYKITEYTNVQENIYAVIFDITKSGKSKDKPTCFFGYPGERPEFDLSAVKPEGYRVSGFYVHANYVHLRNFDVTGIQVTIKEHTQSENVSVRRGNHDITIEHLALHDGMGIGVYITKGSNVLVLNCDAYNNYDSVSEGGKGGNSDGFGSHCDDRFTGNVFRGCRAWCNSDDGFDLISQRTPVVIDHCWALYSGYRTFATSTPGDGNGFKAGGYGKKAQSAAFDAPRHVIKNCIAYNNKSNGFYANHHLGGNDWMNNTAYQNKYEYSMVNQVTWDVGEDVDGYDHMLVNNIAVKGKKGLYTAIDKSRCTLVNNTFLPQNMTVNLSDFENSTDYKQLIAPRNPDGSLPEITFLKLKATSKLYALQMGCQFDYEDTGHGTSIENVAVSKRPSDNAYYNLQGQKIMHPKPGTIYIYGGKKVYIKK
ncbi:pectate lyase [Palleniella muris]|uniref:Pectate lyase n=1 Tax=Palleniella muris TaxID=3038145 RepID=A0AC61QSI7_9BACT|nr:right-handed parallel beta-helix repeat-containing protein [Palleniella muris]TGX83319.1 pectate lyase [Palleniella muris]